MVQADVQRAVEGRFPIPVPGPEAADGRQQVQADQVHYPAAGREVGPQGGQDQQGLLVISVGDFHHGPGQVLVAQHDPQLQKVPGGLLPVPAVHRLLVTLVHGHPAQQRVQVREEALALGPPEPLPQGLQVFPGVVRLALVDPQADQQADEGKLDIRRSLLLNVALAGHQVQHPPGDVLALFKLALRDGALRQGHAVPPQQEAHRDAVLAVNLVVPFAPRAEVLAPVHDAGQAAGDGKLRYGDLPAGQQARHPGELSQDVPHVPLGQGDVQPRQPAPDGFVVGVGPLQRPGEALQLPVPALRVVVLHADGAQHAHPRHQRG